MASRVRERDVVIAGVVIALLQFAAALWDLEVWVRAPLTLLLVFVVPGTLGFLAVKRHLPRTIVEAGVACAASVGTTMLVGFPLSVLPHGFSPVGWSITMAVVVIAAAVVATLREPIGADDGQAAPTLRMPSARNAVGIAACLALVVGGAAVTLTSQHTTVTASHFTELWLTPRTGKLPTVHVRNHEGVTTPYRVVITVGSGPAVTRSVRLAPGASWSAPIAGAAKFGTAQRAVRVNLYRAGTAAVYRHVFVTGTTS